jgi:hypothetical protein
VSGIGPETKTQFEGTNADLSSLMISYNYENDNAFKGPQCLQKRSWFTASADVNGEDKGTYGFLDCLQVEVRERWAFGFHSIKENGNEGDVRDDTISISMKSYNSQ